ncbi:hypothetical protein GGX14DRAFT_569815 [Mycena pura]|uniref:Peroxin-14 n=1 Tax=Mycena pura TaxID=153505 RepID=A0AAD6Y9G3_9AGAR|nr:hypothetical protein GGX14DRAFT_569815 [Mycena pura]
MTLVGGGTLLLAVLYRRVHSRPEKGAEEPATLQETVAELQRALRDAVAGMEKVTAAMDKYADAGTVDGDSASESNGAATGPGWPESPSPAWPEIPGPAWPASPALGFLNHNH